MANIVKDRVLEFTNVTGFDPIQLNGSPIGYRRFGDVLSDGDECYYTLVSESGDWETGISVYDANLNTLDRGTVTDNSVGSNAQIPFQADSKKVFLTFTAQAYKDLLNEHSTFVKTSQVVQSTGNSVTDVMSQDAVTDELNTKAPNMFTPLGTDSVPRPIQSKLRDVISVKDFGAAGDGVTDDTAAFSAFEVEYQSKDVDLNGHTYKVSAIPTGNRYFNGAWLLPTGISRSRWQGAHLTGAGRIAFGDGALESLPIAYSTGSNGTVIAIGYKAMANMTQANKSIAIGPNAQEYSLISRDNIAIGDAALRYVQSVTPNYNQSFQDGTRNIGIGGNAGQFISSGRNNIAIGRNAGQCLTGDVGATVCGSNAYGGRGPIGLSGEMENWAPTLKAAGGTNYSVAIGSYALNKGVTDYCVAVGSYALRHNAKSTGNVAIGVQALENLDINTWHNGGAYTNLGIDGTYTQSGTTLTLDIVGHTLSPGDIAHFRLLDGGSQTFQGDVVPAYVDSTPTADQFTIISPKSITSSGTARLYAKTTAAQQPTNNFNTSVGCLSMHALEYGKENCIMGYRSLNDATNANKNVAVGFRALTGLSTAENCTAIGHDSLRFMQDGSISSGTGINRTGLGFNTRVSGDNQVQLGDSSTTTYVYGTVQNRSDIRDKTDIRDTQLGLNFINKLRPVDYKWDIRDDYFEKDDQGNFKTDDQGNLIPLPKDGSKARSRYHHGLIAQEVQKVIEETGLDFGGFQDHKVNGGCDVMSIGYDELIGPLIKAVQELSEKVRLLEGGE